MVKKNLAILAGIALITGRRVTRPSRNLCEKHSTTPKPTPKTNPVMKNILPILFGAALLPLAANADPAYSNVGGYTTQDLAANTFNLVGLNLHQSVVVAGDLEVVSGAVLTDSDVADFTAVLPQNANNNAVFVLEITSGAAVGTTQEFTVRSGSTITLPGSIAGIAVDDTYQIRIAPTLEQIFGTTTSILTKGATSTTADVVWVPDGTGNYTRYFIRLSDSTFRNAVGGAAAPTVPVVYLDGLFVQKRATPAKLVVTGEVKTVGSTTSVVTGFNPIGTIYPAGVTLQNFGLDDDLTKGATSTTADVVWIPDGLGNYTRYFIRLSDSTWRNAVGGAAAPADLPLTAAVFVQRRGATTTLDMTPPSFYSSL